MSGFLWKYLDLPSVPEELVKDYNTVDFEKKSLITFDDPVRGDPKVHSGSYHRVEVNPELKEWLKENVHDDVIDYGISYTYSDKYPTLHLPHVDCTREYTLMYVLDEGGDDVYTSFYIDKDSPLEHAQGTRIKNFDNLILLDKVKVTKGRWVILNARTIHGVDDIYHPRIAIQISLRKGAKYTQ